MERGKAAVQIKAGFSKREAEKVDRFTRSLSSYLRTTVKEARSRGRSGRWRFGPTMGSRT